MTSISLPLASTYYESDIQRTRGDVASRYSKDENCQICHTSLQTWPDCEPEENKSHPEKNPLNQVIFEAGCCLSHYHRACLTKEAESKINVSSLPFPTFECPLDGTSLDARSFLDQTDHEGQPNRMHKSLGSVIQLTQIERAIAGNDLSRLSSILSEVEGLQELKSYREHPHIVFDSLRLAVLYNNPQALDVLVERGCEQVDVIKTNSGYPRTLTALAVVLQKHAALERLLTHFKTKPNGNSKTRPLIEAAKLADQTSIELLTQRNVTWGLTDQELLDPLMAFMLGKSKADKNSLPRFEQLEPLMIENSLAAKSFRWDRAIEDPRWISQSMTPAHFVAEIGSLPSLQRVSEELTKRKVCLIGIRPDGATLTERKFSGIAQQASSEIRQEYLVALNARTDLSDEQKQRAQLFVQAFDIESIILEAGEVLKDELGLHQKGLLTDPLIFSASDSSGMENFRYLLEKEPKNRAITSPNKEVRNLLIRLIKFANAPQIRTPEQQEKRQYLDKIKELLEHGHPCQAEPIFNALEATTLFYNDSSPDALKIVEAVKTAALKENRSERVQNVLRQLAFEKFFRNEHACKTDSSKIIPLFKALFETPEQVNFVNPLPLSRRLPLETALENPIDDQPPKATLEALLKVGADPDARNEITQTTPRQTSIKLYHKDIFAEELNLPAKSN